LNFFEFPPFDKNSDVVKNGENERAGFDGAGPLLMNCFQKSLANYKFVSLVLKLYYYTIYMVDSHSIIY